MGFRDKMEQRGFNNQGALNAVKRVGHYAIPATIDALGGLAGSAMSGLAGGVAGSALGSYAGKKLELNCTLVKEGTRKVVRKQKNIWYV